MYLENTMKWVFKLMVFTQVWGMHKAYVVKSCMDPIESKIYYFD